MNCFEHEFNNVDPFCEIGLDKKHHIVSDFSVLIEILCKLHAAVKIRDLVLYLDVAVVTSILKSIYDVNLVIIYSMRERCLERKNMLNTSMGLEYVQYPTIIALFMV